MTTDILHIGILTLTATGRGPMLDVLVTSQLGGHIEKLPLTIAEWSSLRATVDVLAAADREFARLQAERDVLKQECREATEQRDALRTELTNTAGRLRSIARGFSGMYGTNAEVIDGFYRGGIAAVLEHVDQALGHVAREQAKGRSHAYPLVTQGVSDAKES